MNDNFDFLDQPKSSNEAISPSKIAADYFNSVNYDEPEEPTPIYLREDASKWDKLSDGQRRLIVFGVLLAVIFLLVLLLGIGSSCGGCSLCGGYGATSDSDADRTVSDAGIVTEMVPVFSEEHSAVTSADVQSENSTPSAEPDNFTEVEAAPADPDLLPVVSGGDAVTPSDALIVVSGADTTVIEERQTVESGFLSACSHEADNEAGSGDTSAHPGFLGFLFGCTGCSDSFDVSFNENLTDDGDSDPDRDLSGALSGSDAEVDIWPQQADDEAYIAMLADQLASISDSFIALGSLDNSLAQYSDPQRVRENDRFRSVTGDILLWCQGAEKYDTSALSGQQALECNRLSIQLAEHLRGYVEDYPVLITGSTSGTDVVDKADQINTIMADIVALYNAVNNITSEQPETALPTDIAE